MILKQVLIYLLTRLRIGLIADSVACSSKKPNALFVISIYQSFHPLSAYGSDRLITPNFDRVERQEILFNNRLIRKE